MSDPEADTRLFADLNPPYSTIVADPPWSYTQGGPRNANGWASASGKAIRVPPYSSMSVDDIAAMPLSSLADGDSHLFLGTPKDNHQDSVNKGRQKGNICWMQPPTDHGQSGMYQRGCRCDLCVEYQRNRNRRRAAAALDREGE